MKTWISTRIEFDWDGNVLSREGFWYDGPVAECKEDQEKKQARLRQEALDKQAGEDRAVFMDMLARLRSSFDPYITGNIGMPAEVKAARKAGAVDTIGKQYINSAGNVNAKVLARSGGQPLGGDAVRDFAGLEIARVGDMVDADRSIEQEDADLALRNKFNAASILSGGAGMANNSAQSTSVRGDNLFAQRLKLAAMPTFWGNMGASSIGAGVNLANQRWGGNGIIWN